MKRAILFAAALTAPTLPACSALDEPGAGRGSPNPRADRLADLGLVRTPPANLIEACMRVARQTNLTVYCPPVVPKGPVEAPRRRRGNAYVFGDENSYGLSLQSESLADRTAAKKANPDFPNFPSRPRGADFRWNSFAARHWVVAARRPAEVVRRSVDQRLQPRSRGVGYEARPRHFTVNGVRATVLTGDIASSGTAGTAHAIVFWQIGGTGYEASVHFDHQARVAEEIARGLITQMVECPPRSPDRRSELCKWVFATNAQRR